jgi:hypothetical protein
MIDTPQKPPVQKPAPATSTEPAKTQVPEKREDEKRIERFPER